MELTPQNCFLGAIPKEGPKVIPQVLNWTESASFVFDMVTIKQQGKLSGVQAMFIDNSQNDQPVSVTTSIINQRVEIAVGYQGYFPLLVTDQVKVTCESSGTGVTPILFLNFPIAASIWPALVAAGTTTTSPTPLPVSDEALEALIVGGAFAVSDAELLALFQDVIANTSQLYVIDSALQAIIIGGALTTSDATLQAVLVGGNTLQVTDDNTASLLADFEAVTDTSGADNALRVISALPVVLPDNSNSDTITVGGTAQDILGADPTRKMWRLQNISGTEALWIRDDGVAAAIDTPGSFYLAPYGYMEGYSQSSVSAIAATTGHKFTLSIQ